MTTINRTNEEKNIKRVVLLGSTFVVFVVAVVIAYILISFEINNAKDDIKIFKNTLIEREQFAIKSTALNLVNDIDYESRASIDEIKKQIKNQSTIAYNLALSIVRQNRDKNKTKIISMIKDVVKSTTNKTDEIHYFIFTTNGKLLLDTKNKNNENKNFLDFKDLNEKEFVKNIVKRNGFVEYFWYIPNSSKIAKKITYSRKIVDLDIVIGSGYTLKNNNSLNKKIISKLKNERFSHDEFIFLYKINSLNNIQKHSKLILSKNIQTSNQDLYVMNKILIENDYKADVFYKYDNKLIFTTYLPNIRTFISSGVYLNTINNIVFNKIKTSNEKLYKKIFFLIMSTIVIASIFFLFSYLLSNKIEKMFKNYRLKISKSQQLLIQKSKMASMGEMLGNIAHQWRQPLSQLSGLFFDIESAYDYKELDKKYLLKRSDEANDLIEYMSKTIDDFREFYNPNTKKEQFNLEKTVQSALKIIGSSLVYHKIDLDLDVDSSIYINGFSNEFSQVILNIISNAKDIALFRDIKNPCIKIYSKIEGKEISLHIEDNCGGIDKENIDKIFEPYFTTKYKYGTGIGLYMCKVIIENKMNAKIYAKNIDCGSVFTIKNLHT